MPMFVLSHLPKSSIKSSTLSLTRWWAVSGWQQPWWSGVHCSLSWLQRCGRHCVSHNAPVEYKRPCSSYFHQSGACWGWPTAI